MDIQKLVTKGCLLYIGSMIALFVLLFGTLALMDQCQSSEREGQRQNYEEARDYKTPCEEHNFMKAYKAVDQLKRDAQETSSYHKSDYMSNYYDALKYVVLQEALYVLGENGDKGLPRIVGIVKEHDANWLYEELIDTYKALGDDELVEQLIKMQNR